MPRPIRYWCETLLTEGHDGIVEGPVTMQTAQQAASVWGREVGLPEGRVFMVRPLHGGNTSYWEWKGSVARRLKIAQMIDRLPD